MDYEQFMTIVRQQIRAEGDDAKRATEVTLQVLGERIDRGQARQMAAQLPPEIAPWIATQTPAENFDANEFVRRVAEREGVDERSARRHARAVLGALWRALEDKEWRDLAAELPRSFAPLLPRGPYVEMAEPERFVGEVAERAHIDDAAAERATCAVLETLAERIAGGEVDDLRMRLPVELHPALERGRARTGGRARPLRLEQFVETIANREGVSVSEATLHASAVLDALRDAVGEEEFLDVTSQLPDDYVRMLATRDA